MSGPMTFGGVDEGDEEDDLFKEFALEDLDAPTTQPAPTRTNVSKPKGVYADIVWM